MRNLVKNFLNAHLVTRAALTLTLSICGGAAARAQTPQETPPPPAAPRQVNLPKPIEKTLANGLRVIVVEDPGMPLVSTTLLVKNGGEVDPAELSGVADMTASLLTKGTKKRSAPQIAQEIEALGGSIASGAGWDASTASVNVMSSKIGPAIEILSDVVLNPTFADEEIERLRQQYVDGLSVALQNPGTLAGFVASRVVFGDAPYGHPVSGTLESLARIKRDDIARIHSTYYRPDNAVLVFGGDIRAEEAYKLAETHLGGWKKPASALMASVAKPLASGKPRVVVVDMPDAGQAAVVFARTGLSRTDPDYFRGIVTNSVLSGFSGRLNQEIRIKRGLSYGARSQLETRRHTGPFIAAVQTKNPSGAEVASLLVSEVGRLAKEPVADTELTPRKSVLIGNFARNLETTEGLVAQVAGLALHGLSLGEINNYIKNVQSVSASDIQQFAGKRLATGEANIIIVGNAKEFIDALRKQYPDVEVITAAELDLNTAGLKKAGTSKN